MILFYFIGNHLSSDVCFGIFRLAFAYSFLDFSVAALLFITLLLSHVCLLRVNNESVSQSVSNIMKFNCLIL